MGSREILLFLAWRVVQARSDASGTEMWGNAVICVVVGEEMTIHWRACAPRILMGRLKGMSFATRGDGSMRLGAVAHP